MRQVSHKELKKVLREKNLLLSEEMTQVSPLRSVYEWIDITDGTAHARVVYIYAKAGDSQASDTIYEIED